ncbi:hypothetical protein CWE23_03620 [Idiomarina aquatica]|uniref:Uncharacterized protein n=1 Tax=Idiomarina aquatica TaxID=1327752 RepID=A0AA94JEG3_9GAMM|nr:hypothetical protein CWE23_03620 [Idiomarina aquatica]
MSLRDGCLHLRCGCWQHRFARCGCWGEKENNGQAWFSCIREANAKKPRWPKAHRKQPLRSNK